MCTEYLDSVTMSFMKCLKDAWVGFAAPRQHHAIIGAKVGAAWGAQIGSVLPFTDARGWKASVHSSSEDSDTEAGAQPPPSYRVTTRARYTYDLRSYEKNAMIILADAEEGMDRGVRSRIQLLRRSFARFGFETVAHVRLTVNQMAEQLEYFFSRDWTNYGAVCVAILAARGEAGMLEARGERYHEGLALRWLTDHQPRELRGKPKIYLTEARRYGPASTCGVYSLPITSSYPDVIAVHIPLIFDDPIHPLRMICEQLGESTFVEDVTAAAQRAECAFPDLAYRPVQVDSTLQLELTLVQT